MSLIFSLLVLALAGRALNRPPRARVTRGPARELYDRRLREGPRR